MERSTATRWVQLCGAALIIVVLAAWAMGATEMPARWGGGPVVIRPFMAVFSAVVSMTHALLLGALAWAARAVAAPPAAHRLLFAAAACAFGMVAVSLAGARGPFAPDDAAVWMLTALVLAPSVLRTLGLWQLAGAAGGRARRQVALGLAVADLTIVAAAIARTPRHVVATVHPTPTAYGLGPVVAMALLAVVRTRWGVARSGR